MANDAQNPLGPQPDFHLISQSHQILAGNHQNLADNHQTLAGELGKIPNLPQFHASNAILDELRLINQRLGGIDGRLNGIDGRLNTMTITMRIGDQNNAARTSNSLLVVSTERLVDLINPEDGTPITGFPTTPGDIGTMTTARLISVLEQLGLQTAGPRAPREQRLRAFIGLKPNPA